MYTVAFNFLGCLYWLNFSHQILGYEKWPSSDSRIVEDIWIAFFAVGKVIYKDVYACPLSKYTASRKINFHEKIYISSRTVNQYKTKTFLSVLKTLKITCGKSSISWNIKGINDSNFKSPSQMSNGIRAFNWKSKKTWKHLFMRNQWTKTGIFEAFFSHF